MLNKEKTLGKQKDGQTDRQTDSKIDIDIRQLLLKSQNLITMS